LVVDLIHYQILGDRVPEGGRLPSESELIAELGIGRVAVREGLRLLEADGLVTIKRGPGGGNFVRYPDIARVSDAISLLCAVHVITLREFLGFRLVVEPPAAALAAQHATYSQRIELAEYLHVTSPSLGEVVDLHVLIGRCTGNGLISLVLQSLHRPFEMHFRRSSIKPGDYEGTGEAHRKIAQMILDRDSAGAEHAMAQHLEAYGAFLERSGLIDAPIVPPPERPISVGGIG
jgi:DNA-binding FadR family transcriptional regulator